MNRAVVSYGSGHLSKLPSHRNPGLEIVYLSHGRLRWQAEGKTELLMPDSIYFTLPWEEHGSVEEFEPGHRWQYIVLALDKQHERPRRRFGFHSSLQLSVSETREITEILTTAKHHAFRAGTALPKILESLVQECQRPGWMAETYISTLARMAVLELCRQIRANDPVTAPVRDRSRYAIDRLVSTIAQHPENRWTLPSMATFCGLKRSQFADLFYKITGDSPITFLNRMRITRARTLLGTTNHSITAIAHACGFASSQYFARQFRAFTVMDARTYRAQLRQS